jgi:hypothetical protein
MLTVTFMDFRGKKLVVLDSPHFWKEREQY